MQLHDISSAPTTSAKYVRGRGRICMRAQGKIERAQVRYCSLLAFTNCMGDEMPRSATATTHAYVRSLNSADVQRTEIR